MTTTKDEGGVTMVRSTEIDTDDESGLETTLEPVVTSEESQTEQDTTTHGVSKAYLTTLSIESGTTR